MAFTIQLWSVSSAPNKLYKGAPSTDSLALEGTLRDGTSIINPTILINVTGANQAKVLSCNYAYISEFSRYYFIRDINIYRNNLWYITLEVDVLNTYHTQILALRAIVARSESAGSVEVVDENAVFSTEPVIHEQVPANVSGSNITAFGAPADLSYTAYNIAITWFSDRATTDSADEDGEYAHITSGVSSPQAPIPNVIYTQSAFGSGKLFTAILTPQQFSALANKLYTESSAKDFIIGTYIFPFALNHSLADTEFQIHQGGIINSSITFNGSYPTDGTNVNLLSAPYLVADFNYYSDEVPYYLREPYSEYQLYLPYYGWIDLPSQFLLNRRIKVFYTPSFVDGKGLIQVIQTDNDVIIWSGECQLGRSVPIVATNETARNIQLGLNAINLGINIAVASALGVGYHKVSVAQFGKSAINLIEGGLEQQAPSVASAVTGYQGQQIINASYMANGVIASGNSLLNTFFSPLTATGSMPTSNDLPLYEPQQVRLRRTTKFPVVVPYNTQYKEAFGLPCGESHVLSELTGYTKCDSFRLTGFTSATDTEISQIDRLLHTGVII